MLMSSGFTDDLFPADETIRFYNRTRTQYPDDAHLALFFGDFGHPRAQNKADVSARADRGRERLDGLLRQGRGHGADGGRHRLHARPARTPRPRAARTRPRNWAKMAKGEIRLESDEREDDRARRRQHRRSPATFNPVGGGGACAHRRRRRPARHRHLPARPGPGRRLHADGLGDRDREVHAARRHLAGRRAAARRRARRPGDAGLARALAPGERRARPGRCSSCIPNGWTFAEGHVPKLELLPEDTNAGLAGGYGRASNDQQPVTVSDLELRLPVVEKPGSFKGLVGRRGEAVPAQGLRAGRRLRGADGAAPEAKQKFKQKGAKLVGTLKCPERFAACNAIKVIASSARRRRSRQGRQGQAQGGRRRQVEEAEAEAERQGPQAARVGPEAEAEARDRVGRAGRAGDAEREGEGEGLTERAAPGRPLSRSRPRWRSRGRARSPAPRALGPGPARRVGSGAAARWGSLLPAEAAGGSGPRSGSAAEARPPPRRRCSSSSRSRRRTASRAAA